MPAWISLLAVRRVDLWGVASWMQYVVDCAESHRAWLQHSATTRWCVDACVCRGVCVCPGRPNLKSSVLKNCGFFVSDRKTETKISGSSIRAKTMARSGHSARNF